jgi:lysozyme
MNLGIIKKHEGLRLRAYKCPADVWTIGYGNTFYEDGTPVRQGEVISKERADRLLFQTVSRFRQHVDAAVTAQLTPNQLDALTSFAYNIGMAAFRRSTLLRKVNANPNDPTIRNEFMRWTRAKGRALRGLEIRRKEEADLYFTK